MLPWEATEWHATLDDLVFSVERDSEGYYWRCEAGCSSEHFDTFKKCAAAARKHAKYEEERMREIEASYDP